MNNKIYAAALAAMAVALPGCDLDEYNPGAGTGGDKTASFAGFEGMQTYCYEPIYGQLFTAFDFLTLTELGTDIFLCAADGTYAKDFIYYEGMAPNSNASNKAFTQLYSQINGCNAIIEKAGGVVDGKADDVRTLVAEAKTLRAFYYLMLTTQYGEITLNLASSENGSNLNPKRTPLPEIYAQIVRDLTEAAQDLDVKPYRGQYARVTKKTALGLLARAYAQGAGEGLEENGVGYWKRCLAVAENLIENKDEVGMYLFDNVEDLWAQANNRNNPEALFIAAGHDYMAAPAANTPKNNIFTYTYPKPNELSDVYCVADKQNYLYGRTNNNVMAPSKYLIDLYGEADARWETNFTCAFGVASGVQSTWTKYDQKGTTVTWTADMAAKYGKDASVVGKVIYPYADYNYVAGGKNQYPALVWKKGDHSGDIATGLESVKNLYATPYPMDLQDDRFSIYLAKEPVADDVKAQSPIVIYNIDDLFDADGKYFSSNANFNGVNANKLFPALNKFNWNYLGVFGKDLQDHNGDVMIMRSAEVYLLAAEAAERTGDAGKAAQYLNVVRERACRDKAQFAATMKLATASEQDVLDEYARELCGEFGRWAILKRHHALESQLAKGNKRAAASFDPAKNYNRPISYNFLSQINNAEEYGNNGY